MSAASERPKTCGSGFALPRGSLGGLSKMFEDYDYACGPEMSQASLGINTRHVQ